MLGSGYMYSKSAKGPRQRIETPVISVMDKLIKETSKKNKMKHLANKYFYKIKNAVEKAKINNRSEIHFYYNYYDFINNGLGKPHGFLQEFMYEMCYDYSVFVT